MGSIVSDKGRLLLQFRVGGKLCREYLGKDDNRDNRREAGKLLRDLEHEIRTAKFDYARWFPDSKNLERLGLVKEPVKVRTFESYFFEFIDSLDISRSTRYDYRLLGRRFLSRKPLGAMPLETVTAADIREATAGASMRRVTMFLQRARAMFDLAIEEELVDRNPALRVKNPKVRQRRNLPEPLSAIELAQILTIAEGQNRNFIVLLVGTGLRPGELIALRRQDVFLQTRKLSISGSRGRFGEGAPKTKASERAVDITDSVAPVIAALRDQLSLDRIGPLFVNQYGRFLNFTNWRARDWKSILKLANVRYRSPYVLRHTFAVRMLELGYNPVYVSTQMGHTTTQMLHRHYATWMLPQIGFSSERNGGN